MILKIVYLFFLIISILGICINIFVPNFGRTTTKDKVVFVICIITTIVSTLLLLK